MKKAGYYSSGQFASMAQVSVRTIRFYDKQNILKPSFVSEAGARFYTDSDFVRLQQILLLKYLGFTLDDIREMTIDDTDYHFMLNSLSLQKKLVQDKREQLQMVENAIDNTISALYEEHQVDWSQLLELIHLTNIEKSFKTQYQNANNVDARIRLHKEFSTNTQGWFPWVYQQCAPKNGMDILEIGCGNSALWVENRDRLPKDIHIVLSDISEGMLRDARRNIGVGDERFSFQVFDCVKIPFADESLDLVIANHVLFYCDKIEDVCREVRRVLKPGGRFVSSTYGKTHMREITWLVQTYDHRITLSKESLYEKFGLENGAEILEPVFEKVDCLRYEDSIEINKAEPLIAYILSCHGNQNQYLLERYQDFRTFVEQKVKKGFRITKDAGVFVCEKK